MLTKKYKSPSHKEINDLFNYYKDKRYDEAEKLAISLSKKFPENQFAWKILGEIFRIKNRLPDSLRALEISVKINSQDHEAYNNLGVTLQKLGKLESAEMSFKKAIELKSSYAEAYNNLGVTLQELGKLESAEMSFKKAIELKSNFSDAHHNLGKVLYLYKNYKKAAENFSLSDYAKSGTYLLKCQFLKNDEHSFTKQLDYLIEKNEINAVIGSFIHRSKIKYGIIRKNPYCNYPLKYIYKTNLTKRYDFENTFINPAKKILNTTDISFKDQNLLINGFQTSGDLFRQDIDFKDEIKKIIFSEVENYRTHFKDSEEGLIKNWPVSYDISAWLINLKSGGKLKPHMHDSGWVSGSIYINVPPKLKPDSGNLVVCLDYEESDPNIILPSHTQNEKKIIDVVTGTLCLFPSSLLHYTIPFESNEERIVLAFDIKSK